MRHRSSPRRDGDDERGERGAAGRGRAGLADGGRGKARNGCGKRHVAERVESVVGAQRVAEGAQQRDDHQERGKAGERRAGRPPQPRERRRALAEPAVHEVAAGDRDGEVDQEGRVRRPAIERDAGNVVEDQREDRRVAPERVEHRRDAEDEEEPQLAREQPAAGDAVPDQEQRRDRAGEEVVRGAVGPGRRVHALPVRPPIIVGLAQRAEDVAEQHRREARRRQRSHRGDAEAEGRPGRGREELHRQHDRNGKQRRADDAGCRKHADAAAGEGEAVVRDRDAMDDEADEREGAEERDLVAPDRHHGGNRGEEHGVAVGAPVERLLEQPQRQREEAVAEDHAGVLQPRRRRAAEHEDHRRDDGAGRGPAAAAEQHQDGERAGHEMREDDGVEKLHRRRGHRPGKQQHGRREQQRLRIGDRGMTAEMVGVPER